MQNRKSIPVGLMALAFAAFSLPTFAADIYVTIDGAPGRTDNAPNNPRRQ